MSSQFGISGVIFVTPVDLVAIPPWERGPMPFAEGGVVATADVRSGYFNDRSGQALYGSDRVHRWAASGAGLEFPDPAFDVIGVEVIRAPGTHLHRNGFVIVHGRMPPSGVDLVDELHRLSLIGTDSAPLRRWCDEVLDRSGAVSANIKRAMTMTYVTPATELVSPLSGAYSAWPASLQWLWLLASTTPADAYLPAPEARAALAESLVRLSAGWQALVLRDGVAFLGSGPDMGPAYRLFQDPEFHFRSIYLDTLLLGQLQRLILTQIADDLAAVSDPYLDPQRLVNLEHELTKFRNVFWWRHLGPQWHANALLGAYQRQHEIPDLLDQISNELGDYSSKAERSATQRSEALLGVLAVVSLPVGAAELTHALGIHEWIWRSLALAVALVLVVAILLTGPGRRIVRLWLLVGRQESRTKKS